ncbi:MAG: hypothetical protein EAZ96_25395 [Oscillatoriales cyanobacterium]|nr:MAG: hypothetical protein EAZ96_25395 [Oscillatoriales cyanobacterium]
MIYRKSFSASPDKQQSRQAGDWRPQPAYYKYKSFREKRSVPATPQHNQIKDTYYLRFLRRQARHLEK